MRQEVLRLLGAIASAIGKVISSTDKTCVSGISVLLAEVGIEVVGSLSCL